MYNLYTLYRKKQVLLFVVNRYHEYTLTKKNTEPIRKK